MFHRSSLLFTGIVLIMGAAWFGAYYFLGDGKQAFAQARADQSTQAQSLEDTSHLEEAASN